MHSNNWTSYNLYDGVIQVIITCTRHIYTYLSDKTLPNDEKVSRRNVIESESHTLLQCVRYHWYQRRCRSVPKELRHIQQIVLSKVLSMDALKSYHDSLAGGGHLGIEKVRSSPLQKNGIQCIVILLSTSILKVVTDVNVPKGIMI